MLKDKRLFLFDIDGTLAVGDTLFEASAELLHYIDGIGGRSYFITNNSTKSGQDYVEKFAKSFGLQTTREQFITSGYMTIRFLKEHYAGEKIFVLGTASFLRELRKNGLLITEEADPRAACAVAAYDNELTYEKLTRICRLLSLSDIPFYGTNPDLCCPVDFGFVPDCGSICQMITNSTSRNPVYLGKPSEEVVKICMQASGFGPEETLVVGDRLYTDIACGINAGVDTCVVLTGEASLEDLRETPFRPSFTFHTVKDLLHALET